MACRSPGTFSRLPCCFRKIGSGSINGASVISAGMCNGKRVFLRALCSWKRTSCQDRNAPTRRKIFELSEKVEQKKKSTLYCWYIIRSFIGSVRYVSDFPLSSYIFLFLQMHFTSIYLFIVLAMMKNHQTMHPPLFFFVRFFLPWRFYPYFLYFCNEKYIYNLTFSPLPRPGPRIVLEKKVFQTGSTFDCSTGVDAESYELNSWSWKNGRALRQIRRSTVIITKTSATVRTLCDLRISGNLLNLNAFDDLSLDDGICIPIYGTAFYNLQTSVTDNPDSGMSTSFGCASNLKRHTRPPLPVSALMMMSNPGVDVITARAPYDTQIRACYKITNTGNVDISNLTLTDTSGESTLPTIPLIVRIRTNMKVIHLQLSLAREEDYPADRLYLLSYQIPIRHRCVSLKMMMAVIIRRRRQRQRQRIRYVQSIPPLPPFLKIPPLWAVPTNWMDIYIRIYMHMD